MPKKSILELKTNAIRHDVYHYCTLYPWPTIENTSYSYNECMCWPFHLMWLDPYCLRSNSMFVCAWKNSVSKPKTNAIMYGLHHYASSDPWPMLGNDSHACYECMCWPFHLMWFHSNNFNSNIMHVCVQKYSVFPFKRNIIWHDVHYYATSNPWSIIEDDSYAYYECMCCPFHLVILCWYHFNSDFMRVRAQKYSVFYWKGTPYSTMCIIILPQILDHERFVVQNSRRNIL